MKLESKKVKWVAKFDELLSKNQRVGKDNDTSSS